MRIVCLACLIALTVAAACTPHKMTTSQFKGDCVTWAEAREGGVADYLCDPFLRERVCNDFTALLAAQPAGKKECIDQCQAAKRRFAAEDFSSRCQTLLEHVSRQCEQYCRQHND